MEMNISCCARNACLVLELGNCALGAVGIFLPSIVLIEISEVTPLGHMFIHAETRVSRLRPCFATGANQNFEKKVICHVLLVPPGGSRKRAVRLTSDLIRPFAHVPGSKRRGDGWHGGSQTASESQQDYLFLQSVLWSG